MFVVFVVVVAAAVVAVAVAVAVADVVAVAAVVLVLALVSFYVGREITAQQDRNTARQQDHHPTTRLLFLSLSLFYAKLVPTLQTKCNLFSNDESKMKDFVLKHVKSYSNMGLIVQSTIRRSDSLMYINIWGAAVPPPWGSSMN